MSMSTQFQARNATNKPPVDLPGLSGHGGLQLCLDNGSGGAIQESTAPKGPQGGWDKTITLVLDFLILLVFFCRQFPDSFSPIL